MANDDESTDLSMPTPEAEKHAIILSIKEINLSKMLREDSIVRTWGRVVLHDTNKQVATLMDNSGEKISVSTEKIEPFHFTLGGFYQLIGEMVKIDKALLILQPRVVTSVNDLDLEHFSAALKIRRKFLDKNTM